MTESLRVRRENRVQRLKYAAVVGVLAFSAPGSTGLVSATSADDPGLGAQPQVERPFDVAPPPPLEPPAPLVPPAEPATPQRPQAVTPTRSAYGIPASALDAYRGAADAMRRRDPGCRLDWSVLAGIGKVESSHAYGGAVDRDGDTLRPIVGIPLTGGRGTARISDSDDGRYDGDARFDRAVGPMQFIPSTWRRWGSDGNGDGRAHPSNMYDATLSAGRYLCVGGRDLSTSRGLTAALLSYNHSMRYVELVRSWIRAYQLGRGFPVPDGDGTRIPASAPAATARPAPATPKKTTSPKQTKPPEPSAPDPSPSPKPRPAPSEKPVLPEPVDKLVDETVGEPVGEALDKTTTAVGGLLGG